MLVEKASDSVDVPELLASQTDECCNRQAQARELVLLENQISSNRESSHQFEHRSNVHYHCDIFLGQKRKSRYIGEKASFIPISHSQGAVTSKRPPRARITPEGAALFQKFSVSTD